MRILLATDGSRYARAAARFLARFVRGEGRQVDVVTIVPEGPRSDHPARGRSPPFDRQWRAEARARVEATASTLRDRGFSVRALIDSGRADRVVVELAGREAYDLVVAGAKGRGATPFFEIGSVALALLEQVPIAVLLVREREPGREQTVTRPIRPLRVLLATDGMPYSNAAIDRFMSLVHDANTEITVVSVRRSAEELPALVPPVEPATESAAEHAARVHVNDAINRLAPLNAVTVSSVLEGDPAEVVVAEALERDVDLIVLGSRGVQHEPRDGVAVRIARAAPCSVLVVRES